MEVTHRMQFTREEQIRQRLNWFIEAREPGSVSRACKNCGISRKTYYKSGGTSIRTLTPIKTAWMN